MQGKPFVLTDTVGVIYGDCNKSMESYDEQHRVLDECLSKMIEIALARHAVQISHSTVIIADKIFITVSGIIPQ